MMRKKSAKIQRRRCHQAGFTRREAGFTLVEMLATVALLALLGWIVYFVFLSAQVVASESRALGEVYQTARGICKVMEADLEGAWLRRDSSTDFGVIPPSVGLIFYAQGYTDEYGNPRFVLNVDNLGTADVKGITDYWVPDNSLPEGGRRASDPAEPSKPWENSGLVLLTTVSPEGGQDRAQARVMYILKANGDLVRGVQYDDTLTDLDYAKATTPPEEINRKEQDFVIARRVTALQFRFLSKRYFPGPDEWLDRWETSWREGAGFKRYLPRAVEVRIRIRDPRGRIKSTDDIQGESRLGLWFTQVFAIPAALDWP